MTRPQVELPLYACEPAEVGVGRCYEHRLDPRHGSRNVRLVIRLCPRNQCSCPICLEGDAMVRRFEGDWVAA